MKIFHFLLFFVLNLNIIYPQSKSGTSPFSGYKKIINDNWTFSYFPSESAEKGYESSAFDDSKWQAVSIPHTWSIYETTGDMHPFIMNASEKDNPYWWNGWGWYRKHFIVNRDFSDKKIFIEFEGVQKYCKVWINGVYLGDHKGGYGSFDFDITGHIKAGGDNVIAVAVNNTRTDKFRIPPMNAGNFNVYGGIYRDVTIAVKNKLFIPMQGSASHEGGTFVTTPALTEKSGTVRVRTWVKNDNSYPSNCTLQTTIYDKDRKIVQQIKTTTSIKPGQFYTFDQLSKTVRNPHLWSPDDPYLYKIVSELYDDKTLVDTYTSPLGFRWFRWDYKENFLYVNDKKTILHGGNRHQEFPWLGDAIPKWITVNDFTDMADNLGYNFMRTAHYPNDRIVYDISDSLGIIIDEEVPNIKNLDFSEEVQQQQLKEMIRRDRNHPAIMMWSMGNETDKAVDSKYAIGEDTTRILTSRRVSNGSQGKYAKHNDDNLPIENLLRCTVRGWYNSDIRNLEPSNEQYCGTEEHQMNMLIKSGLFGKGNLSTWIYEDHGADREYLNAPLLHVNPKGYVDMYRVPKYSYYFWQANYSPKPVIFIIPHFWRRQYIGQKKDIVITSNCEKIELKVNGVSKGIKIPDQSDFHTVRFEGITIEDAILSATGTMKGKSFTNTLAMAGDPAKVILKASHSELPAGRSSVAIIQADITDSRGNHVYGSGNTLKWVVSGPARLVGPAMYVSDTDHHHEMEGQWYIDVPVSNVIRSTGEPGKIKVTVFSAGLVSGSVEINCEAVIADNTVITETVLRDDGRSSSRKTILFPSRLEDTPDEISLINNPVKLSSSNKDGYRNILRNSLFQSNRKADTSSVEFRTLIDLLSSLALNNNGLISTEDYNFNIANFNNCRLITDYINATKLPQPFKEGLRLFYSGSLIRDGNEKNAGDEMNWMNWIPSGGTVVYFSENTGAPPIKGTLFSSKGDLTEMISLVHPGFSKLSKEAQSRAIEFIAKMNPFIHAEIQSEIIDGTVVTKTQYIAEKGKPVLIPLYKFIAG
ncbi:MAG TPA: glycoside hydrolase family 2 TIM barrel-domain containing protein [Bacteroidales bacterium]|nr:glycoside hydrolase family 2 TIM barrel-domain containing protein [Bacteroidales bacterium]